MHGLISQSERCLVHASLACRLRATATINSCRDPYFPFAVSSPHAGLTVGTDFHVHLLQVL